MIKNRKTSMTPGNQEELQTKVVSDKSGDAKSGSITENDKSKSGMSFYVASFFLVAQMAGAGFLALPKAIADCGWAGLFLLLGFCLLVGFSGTRLGQCWVILEERWPADYSKAIRRPYIEIACRAYGRTGRILTLCAQMTNMIGSSIVYIILMSQFLSSMVHEVPFCITAIIVGAVLILPTWAGTPNDFWQAALLSVIAAFVSFIVVLTELLLDKDTFPEPRYDNPSFISFSLGFGTLLFCYGGASVFPTIQNDMRERSQFWKSVMLAFAALIVMYVPVATVGYSLLGSDVPSNILLYAGTDLSIPLKVAVILEVIHLVVTYMITSNTVGLILEEMIGVPPRFGWKRCLLRTSIVLIELLVCLSFPDFGLVLNLVGGSAICMVSFIFPPIFYMKLVKDSSLNSEWPQRTLETWEKTLLISIVILGVVGGLSSTGSAVLGIINKAFSASCFSKLFS